MRTSTGLSHAQAKRRVRQLRAELTWDNEIVMQDQPKTIQLLRNGRPVPLRREALDPSRPGWEQIKDSTVAWCTPPNGHEPLGL